MCYAPTVALGLHVETFSEVELPADRVVNEEVAGALALNAAFINEVGAINDGEGFAHIMVRDENGVALFPEVDDDLLNFVNRDGINARKRFVEHQQLWIRHERAGDGEAAFFTAAQSERSILANMRDSELRQQTVAPLASLSGVERECFEHRVQILLDGQLAKDRFFLGQVAKAEPRTDMHGEPADIGVIEKNGPAVRAHETDDHVKACGLPRSVGAEEPDDFSVMNVDVHPIDNRAARIALDQFFCAQQWLSGLLA